jgi:hypothetical protein
MLIVPYYVQKSTTNTQTDHHMLPLTTHPNHSARPPTALPRVMERPLNLHNIVIVQPPQYHHRSTSQLPQSSSGDADSHHHPKVRSAPDCTSV